MPLEYSLAIKLCPARSARGQVAAAPRPPEIARNMSECQERAVSFCCNLLTGSGLAVGLVDLPSDLLNDVRNFTVQRL